jgi:hypothetical protein
MNRVISHLASLLAPVAMAQTAPAGESAPLPTKPAIVRWDGAPKRNIIWDDDCARDSDCAFSEDAIHHWIDTGNANVLAFIANSSNPYSAPIHNIWETYYGHTSIPIGAYLGSAASESSTSSWAASLVSQFNADDSRTNYTDCVTVYRRALAGAPNASVNIVSTGFATCLVPLLQSSADSVSPLTGAQLVRAKVAALYLMGGDYPTGDEWNFQQDPANFNTLFTTWTTQNGYPPIYLNGLTPGLSVISGAPPWFGSGHPAVAVATISGESNRPSWDGLSIYQAIFGTSAFVISADGTNSVDASTGTNIWHGVTASGHYYVTLKHAVSYYESLLDGQRYTGANWWLPQKSTR